MISQKIYIAFILVFVGCTNCDDSFVTDIPVYSSKSDGLKGPIRTALEIHDEGKKRINTNYKEYDEYGMLTLMHQNKEDTIYPQYFMEDGKLTKITRDDKFMATRLHFGSSGMVDSINVGYKAERGIISHYWKYIERNEAGQIQFTVSKSHNHSTFDTSWYYYGKNNELKKIGTRRHGITRSVNYEVDYFDNNQNRYRIEWRYGRDSIQDEITFLFKLDCYGNWLVRNGYKNDELVISSKRKLTYYDRSFRIRQIISYWFE